MWQEVRIARFIVQPDRCYEGNFRFVVSADALELDMPLSSLFLMAPLAALMSYMAITPGGLGLREAVMGFVTTNLGFSFAEGMFVGAVDRAILLGIVTILGGLAFWVLWVRVKLSSK